MSSRLPSPGDGDIVEVQLDARPITVAQMDTMVREVNGVVNRMAGEFNSELRTKQVGRMLCQQIAGDGVPLACLIIVAPSPLAAMLVTQAMQLVAAQFEDIGTEPTTLQQLPPVKAEEDKKPGPSLN